MRNVRPNIAGRKEDLMPFGAIRRKLKGIAEKFAANKPGI
jgi:hypothetical protein